MHVEAHDWPLALIGSSAAVSRARAAMTAAAAGPGPVWIVADQGLGADAIARSLHERGGRSRPFVTVDCGGGPDDVERQLFGRASPATVQNNDVTVVGAGCALVKARQGTVYLRQIADMPASAQRRLARVLRDREVVVSGRRVRLTARIVADAPGSAAAEGQLRPDLLRRLSRVRIEVPALRERPADMRDLAPAVAAELSGGGDHGTAFTQAAITVLAAAAWPGNLDELRDVLSRVLRTAPAGTIRQEDVLAHLPIDGAFARMAPEVSLREARRQFERDYIASVLERHRWRMSEAARTLGIERANLYRKTRQLGIVRRASMAS